jgi:hypothetical protein
VTSEELAAGLRVDIPEEEGSQVLLVKEAG